MAKNKPASKKVVLLLVEGFSDRNALKKIMQRIYKNRLLVFRKSSSQKIESGCFLKRAEVTE